MMFSVKIVLAYALSIAVGLVLYCLLTEKYTVPVMMYHHVADAEVIRADTVSPANFERHLQFLKSRGYQVLSIADLIAGIKTNRRFVRNSVVITFDDGNKNNFTQAFVLLRKYGYRADFFISPGTIGQEDVLSWDDVQRMQAGGMTFGSHGMRQAYLPEVSSEQQNYEIVESKRILEEKLKTPVNYYAYPIGGFTEEIKKLLVDAGYQGALTTNRGHDRFNKNVFEINRIRFGDSDGNDLILSAKLSGYYNLFRKLKKSH